MYGKKLRLFVIYSPAIGIFSPSSLIMVCQMQDHCSAGCIFANYTVFDKNYAIMDALSTRNLQSSILLSRVTPSKKIIISFRYPIFSLQNKDIWPLLPKSLHFQTSNFHRKTHISSETGSLCRVCQNQHLFKYPMFTKNEMLQASYLSLN